MTGNKRDCLFYVADRAMADVLDGFMTRGQLESRIGCRSFAFDFDADVLEAARFGMGHDGGVFKHCHRMLQENGYLDTHERLVVMLDQQFGGERPATEIRDEIMERLCSNGWSTDTAEVIVIDPELEVWVWQDNPHVATTLGYRGPGTLREALRNDKQWPAGQIKPLQPKELFMAVCRQCRTPYNSSLYRDIVERVSVKHCVDPSFQQLVATFQRWFPLGESV